MAFEPKPPVIPTTRTCPFDPDPEYIRLREKDPISPVTFNVAPGRKDGWLATRHEDVRKIMADARFSHRADLLALVSQPPFEVENYDPKPSPPGSFVRMDAPEHTRYRRLLTGFFTVRRIQQYEPTLAGIIDGCLDELEALEPPVDLLTAFIKKVVYRSVHSVMGVPESDIAELDEHFSVLMGLQYSLEEFIHHNGALDATLERIVQYLFDNPSDKLLGQLIATGELTQEEVTNICWITIGGALDTTPNMLGLGTFALLEHPEQLAKVRARPELMERAVEELLRYLTISHLGASRVALEDVEIGGRTIEAGQTVVLSLPAANRDPEQFERPEEFDVTRPSRRHVAFGFGIHQCLGQHLARATLRIGFQKLFDRFPGLRLAVPADEVPLRSIAMHYGVQELPVTWR
ncbi:cytochrome P450 [Wenjunlia tyrosinilytica]|uniref:Cytochrome P450 n=1 Tax=Wenjunlia tyrosinilytica TaxID=1544741 RepID=A0A918A008_9ACTN|nr:cytochrome P450 [Wenjunlia tyrosinilytica]GGP00693.1 cytochrome P450 [Wenjunlia tyrosinilytica]